MDHLRFPSRSSIDRATYQQLVLWYEELPTPRNDIEQQALTRICERMGQLEVRGERRLEGCWIVLVFLLILTGAIAYGAR